MDALRAAICNRNNSAYVTMHHSNLVSDTDTSHGDWTHLLTHPSWKRLDFAEELLEHVFPTLELRLIIGMEQDLRAVFENQAEGEGRQDLPLLIDRAMFCFRLFILINVRTSTVLQ